MRLYKTILSESTIIDSITCDLCGAIFHEEANMLHLEKSFGYEVVHFSDMDLVSLDMCERCLFDFLNTYQLLTHCCVTPYYTQKKKEECLNE
jgi:hypothetical protein